MHKQSWFVTLTYDDKNLPRDGSLNYRHFQQFMRRLRKAQAGKVRFYMAGEYGERTARPHYHACLFGAVFRDLLYYRKSPSGFTLWRSDKLDSLWGKGLCSLGALTFESAAYTAGYINKKILISEDTPEKYREHYSRVDTTTGEVRSVLPEFARMSLNPGIGATWVDRYRADVFPRDYCIVDGRKVPVPRYYLDRIKDKHGVKPAVFCDLESDRFERSLQTDPRERTAERREAKHRVARARAALGSRGL